jgi:pyridoxamine 5'-phosphate oxidase-like protein
VTLLLPVSAVGVLQEGRQAHLAVESRGGPHVTPDLYAWSGGALWFAVAGTTLKAKVLARRPAAGVVVSVPGRSVVLAGSTSIVDPRSVRDLVGAVPRLPDTARALTRYATRNAPDLFAFLGDATRGRLGWGVPPARVLIRFDPTRAALISGRELIEGYGAWSGVKPGPTSATTAPAGGEAAVVALPGPVALPCRWFEEEGVAHLPAGARALLDVHGAFPVSVVVDEYGAPGPAAKEGTLLHGQGRLGRKGRVIEIDPERVVTWDGVETASAPAG